MNSTLRILGIDPGLNITGYGVLEINDGLVAVVEAGIVRSKQSGQLQDRLASIPAQIVPVRGETESTRCGCGTLEGTAIGQ